MSEGDLKGVYKSKYNKIKNNCIVLLDGIDNQVRDNILNSILSKFLVAQNDGVKVEEIVGNNIDKYCEEVCSKLPIKYRFKYIFEIFKYWAYIMLLFNGFELIFNHNNILGIQTSLFGLIISVIVCLIIIQVYNLINKNNIFFSIVDIILLCITAYASYLFFNILIPTYIIVIITILVIITYNLLYFKDKFSSNNIDIIISQYLKRSRTNLNDINKLNKSRGKKKINEKQYLDNEIYIAKKNIRINNIKLLLPFVFSILPSIITLFHNNIFDTLFFFIVLLIIECVIFIPIFNNNYKYNKKLLKKYNYFKEKNIPMNKWN